jgi:hypothetical protein
MQLIHGLVEFSAASFLIFVTLYGLSQTPSYKYVPVKKDHKNG